MQKTNIVFIKNQLIKFLLEKTDIKKIESIKYIVEYDKQEKQEAKTNSDDIMMFWTLPEYIGKSLDIDEVCEKLVTYKNEIPLWIKIKISDNNKNVILSISKRFRKMKIINERHKTNKFRPILEE